MVPPVYNLMEFGRWPTGIYHPLLKILITCVIPFSFVAFYPAGFLVRGGDPWPALLTPVVALCCLFVAGWLWRSGIKRYHSSGS
jgi:ABC-2 type transport system permease protein